MTCQNCENPESTPVKIINMNLCSVCTNLQAFKVIAKTDAKKKYHISEINFMQAIENGMLQSFKRGNSNFFYEKEVMEFANKLKDKSFRFQDSEIKLQKLLSENGFVREDFEQYIIDDFLSGGKQLLANIEVKIRFAKLDEVCRIYQEPDTFKYIAYVNGKMEYDQMVNLLKQSFWIKNHHVIYQNNKYSNYQNTVSAVRNWIANGRPPPNPPDSFSGYIRDCELEYIQNLFSLKNNIDKEHINNENIKGYIDKIYQDHSKYIHLVPYYEFFYLACNFIKLHIEKVIKYELVTYIKNNLVAEESVNSDDGLLEDLCTNYYYGAYKLYSGSFTDTQIWLLIKQITYSSVDHVNKNKNFKPCCGLDCRNPPAKDCIDLRCGNCCLNTACRRHY